MKKILFSCLLASVSSLYFGQTVFSDNFEAATLGNLGTDITGTTAGQGGWYTTAAATASNSAVSNFQVQTNNATHGKVLSILGSATSTGTKQINQNSKLVSVWGSRTAGNDILQYEFDMYSGAATTSQNSGRIYLWDEAANMCLIGFSLNMATKQHTLIAYSDPENINGQAGQEVGNWGYTFNAGLDANTWYKVGIAWDSMSGDIYYKILNESTGEIIFDEIFIGSAPGANPNLANVQVLATPNSTVSNNAATTVLFDNIKLKATATADLLAVNDIANTKANLSVYPNPFKDVLKLSDAKNASTVTITDFSGRTVKTLAAAEELQLGDLKKGAYLVTIKSNDGTVSTTKVIKD